MLGSAAAEREIAEVRRRKLRREDLLFIAFITTFVGNRMRVSEPPRLRTRKSSYAGEAVAATLMPPLFANAYSFTTFPPMRCSWMIRTNTSGVQE